MANMSQASRRLKSDYLELKKDPILYIRAEPDDENALIWHYCIKGPKETDYHGGYYYGKLKVPKDYPFKPPFIIMNTPSGRFVPNKRICLLSYGTLWNPCWTGGAILNGLCSFMLEEYDGGPNAGSISETSDKRKELAKQSGPYNMEHFPKFNELFPDMVFEIINRRI